MRTPTVPQPRRVARPAGLTAGLAVFLSAWLLLQPVLTPPAQAAPTQDPKAMAARIKSEGARYSRAVAAIAGIERMSLRTPEDAARVLAILERHDPDLRYWPERIAAIALENRSLTLGAERRLRGWMDSGVDRPEIERRLDDLHRDPTQLRSWEGSSEVSRAARAEREQHQAIFTRVAAKLRRAAAELERGRHAALVEGLRDALAKLGQAVGGFELVPSAHADPLTIGVLILAMVAVAVTASLLTLYSAWVLSPESKLNLRPLPDPKWTHERCAANCLDRRNACLAAVLDRHQINSFSTECVHIPECEADRLSCWAEYYEDCYWKCPGFE